MRESSTLIGAALFWQLGILLGVFSQEWQEWQLKIPFIYSGFEALQYRKIPEIQDFFRISGINFHGGAGGS